MQYRSTRDFDRVVSASQAIVQGISEEGGLFVPVSFPTLSWQDLMELCPCSYVERAEKILSLFLTDFTWDEVSSCVKSAYTEQKFPDGPAQVSLLQEEDGSSLYLLELWHGPTCAFKDLALQLLPQLLTVAIDKLCADKTAVILTATSGDTGKAALEGFKDVPGTKVLVFYPRDGVSPMQKRQMVTQEGDNVAVCAIAGNFDDAQTAVKKIFRNPCVRAKLAAKDMFFSSANSINLGRLLPQIVYYISAYCDLMASGEIEYEKEQVNVAVPTGNFGNILSAYYAKKMGLPIKRLICASNENNVLTDFIRTGVYNCDREFYNTASPSMDILVSSNLERLLSDLTGSDTTVRGWMKQLSTEGHYAVDEQTLAKLKSLFWAGYCDDEQTLEEIGEMYNAENYLLDPHSAVGVNVYKQYMAATGDCSTPAIIASTASPFKFADSVLRAIGEDAESDDAFVKLETLAALTRTEVPAPIEALQEKPVRFTESCKAEEMDAAVLRMAGI